MCKRPAFVRWFYYRSGWRGLLCRGHLDIWLDNADDEPELEPDRLEFLR